MTASALSTTTLSPRDAARERLRDVDERIARQGSRRSLAPNRRTATPLSQLGVVLPAGDAESLQHVFLDALASLGQAMLEAFPENLFWDLDAVAQSLLEQARGDEAPAAHLSRVGERLASLQHLFGAHSAIRFRYIHDFTYGFDWSRWVRKDPARRASIGPYDLAFIERMHRRGQEMLQLIEEDDATYPRLRDGGPRNPFSFSREPRAELDLLRMLARRDELPVRAWERCPDARHDRDHRALRKRAAQALAR